MLKYLLLIIFVFLESPAFCQGDPLTNFETNKLENWPVDSSTINYENTRKTKLRSIDDCIREINNQDLNPSEVDAIEGRMEDISIFLIHQYYPTFIIEQNDLEKINDMIKGCDTKLLFSNKSIINTSVQNIFNVFNRKTISYLETMDCSNRVALESLNLYLIKNK